MRVFLLGAECVDRMAFRYGLGSGLGMCVWTASGCVIWQHVSGDT